MNRAERRRREKAMRRHSKPPNPPPRTNYDAATQCAPQAGAQGAARLFVAIPCYSGSVAACTAKAMMELIALCAERGIWKETHFLGHVPLVQAARNFLAAAFMRSTCTHLLFVDADIGFYADDALKMMGLAADGSPYDVIGGTYAKKI